MSQRTEQVGEEIKKAIGEILTKEIDDPRKGFVTLTRVAMSADLRHAKVFYSVIGDDTQKLATQEMFEEHLRDIRHSVARKVHLKFAAELQFVFDPSIEDSFRIDAILKKIKKEE